ncbi:MAG: glycosyltransferase family 4 protein [Pseudomonadota bacterium]
MRLLFISQLFDPEYSIKGLGFLGELQAKGVEIDVVTTFPNYPTGKVFAGYKVRPWQIEYQQGIRVIRVYSYISHSKSKIARALSYLSFMVSAFMACLLVRRPDVIYAYHPQLTTGFIAIFFKWLRCTPFITDVQDLWPDALAATGLHRTGRLYRLLDDWCGFVYRHAAHIVVLSHGYKAALIARGIESGKVTVVYNWHAYDAVVSDVVADSLLPRGYQYQFMYAGNLGTAQSLKPVIDAFSRLQNDSVSLVMIGAGVEQDELARYTRSIAAENVFFLGYVPSGKIRAYLAQADVLVVHLRDEDLFKITIPSKIQAYLSSGKPILMAVGGEANQIVSNAGAGETALPENPDSICDAARRLLLDRERWALMGANGRACYEKDMARHIGVEKIMGVLASLGAR